MRKFFSQRTKNKSSQPSNLVLGSSISSLLSSTRDDDPMKVKPIAPTSSEPASAPAQLEENKEKSKKLFVVVSDVDSTCDVRSGENSRETPVETAANSEPVESHLLSVDECENNESLSTLQSQYPLTRKRSSTGSGQHLVRYREQNPKKFVEERLRRRSWMVSHVQLLSTSVHCPSSLSTSMNTSQSPDILPVNHQNPNLLRLRRLRLGQSEPNLNSFQMNSFYQTSSPSQKSSPRTSSANTNDPHRLHSSSTPSQAQHYFPYPLRRPSSRRSNLSGLNLINLKYALRKQLSPQQQQQLTVPSQTLCSTASEPQDTTKSSFNPSLTSAFKPIINLDDNTNRRWSLTSAPSSSGYGTTTPITCHSHESSQYSSFERLQHQQQQQQHHHHHPSQQQPLICTCKHTINATNSNDGSISTGSPHDDFVFGSLQRLESRSISMSMLDANISSSPCKMMILPDQDINAMAYIYKERYPTAKVQMEERLQNFIDSFKNIDKFDHCSDGSARFIHNQIVELAKDCLEKSQEDLITTDYFNEMTDNLERLLLNAKEKCPQAIENLQTVVRKLLLTTARSARLLECLEFDPEDFLRTLDEVECQAKTNGNIKQDIPKYICSKLNLERNPLDVIDALQVTETETSEETNENKTQMGLSESETESFTDANYLTITPNTTFPPLERSISQKGPCEDDFEVIKLISNGAYGAVHLVRHRQTQERYAMKKISKTHLVLRNQVEQAFVERDIMTFTDNPFVVALICTFETKKHLCLVMEYVEGGDVATLLKNIGGPLNIDIARMYFAETTLAVEYLHSYGIIHRDLKPDNLLITAVGHIKLTDFGLSKIGLMSLTTNFYEKHIDKETKAFNDKQICGTPSYIAPEVILRQGYGKPVDWWSMGIILYEFLVGVPPFTGDTPDELFANVINGEIEWPDLLDESTMDLSSSACFDASEQAFCPEAKDLIEQLLQHDPSKRLGTLAGAYEIKTHPFLSCINWNNLLREKADFVPVLESPDDTSYFDTRQDRYHHSDDDILSTNNQQQSSAPPVIDNDSEVLFAAFSSVSLKYASELSGTSKSRHSHKQTHPPSQQSKAPNHQDSNTTNTTASEMSSTDVSRTNSCSECFHPDNVIRINSPSGFQPLAMTQSMPSETSSKAGSLSVQQSFGSDTFEPLLVSSDGDSSEPSSTKKISSTTNTTEKFPHSNNSLSRKNSSSSSSVQSSSNLDEKRLHPITTSTPTSSTTTTTNTTSSSSKHHKQRKTSLKLLEQQNAHDSGDDNQQQKGKPRHHHKKTRIPRALSPLQPRPSSTLPTPATSGSINASSKSQDILSSDRMNLSPISNVSQSMHNEGTHLDDVDFKNSSSSQSLAPPTTTTTTTVTTMKMNPTTKPVKYNNQQRSFPRSLSKSFSSSSSSCSPPPTTWFNHPDERSYRHTQRHNMAVSPLERDTTLKAQQQHSFTSTTMSSMHPMNNNLRPPIIIRRGPRSFGFTLQAVKVFQGNTDYYTTQHVVVAVEGPAQEAGLRPKDVITHVNDRPVAGLLHSEVIKLILSGSPKLSIRAIPSSETQFRTGGRRRSPSKQKLRYQQPHYDRKPTMINNNNNTSHHQPYCQKYRTNSTSGSNNYHSNNANGNNTNKKHPHNNSLFRRLSERKVARDIEAAAAAGVSLTIPTSQIHQPQVNTTLTSTNNSILSSSLPLLPFNQHTGTAIATTTEVSHERSIPSLLAHPSHIHPPNILDSSEWPPLQAPQKPPTPTGTSTSEPDSPQPTLLPSLVRQKNQISVSPLAKSTPGSASSLPHPSGHQTLCKTFSEPPIFSRHHSSSGGHIQSFPSQSYPRTPSYYPPMCVSHPKKRAYPRLAPVHPPASSHQPPFFLDIFQNRTNLDQQQCGQLDYSHETSNTRSSSTESSASSTSTIQHVDSLSSNPVIPPKQCFYRRR